MAERLVSAADAFEAMVRFLDAYRVKTGSDTSVRAVLSDIQSLTEDRLPADPATWDDWIKALDSVIRDQRDIAALQTKRRNPAARS